MMVGDQSACARYMLSTARQLLECYGLPFSRHTRLGLSAAGSFLVLRLDCLSERAADMSVAWGLLAVHLTVAAVWLAVFQ